MNDCGKSVSPYCFPMKILLNLKARDEFQQDYSFFISEEH